MRARTGVMAATMMLDGGTSIELLGFEIQQERDPTAMMAMSTASYQVATNQTPFGLTRTTLLVEAYGAITLVGYTGDLRIIPHGENEVLEFKGCAVTRYESKADFTSGDPVLAATIQAGEFKRVPRTLRDEVVLARAGEKERYLADGTRPGEQVKASEGSEQL